MLKYISHVYDVKIYREYAMKESLLKIIGSFILWRSAEIISYRKEKYVVQEINIISIYLCSFHNDN